MIKTIRTIIPNAKDATAFFRSTGVLPDLFGDMGIRSINMDETTWASVAQVDAVFIQRPFDFAIPKIIDMHHDQGKGVWVDFDDDLFSVPFSNPTYKLYSDTKRQNAIMSAIAKADIVTVSTEALKTKFQKILTSVAEGNPNDKTLELSHRKIEIIPNAYNAQFMGPLEKTEKQRKVVLWRGSSTHDKDLMEYTAAIGNVMEKHPEFTYTFIGSPFWWSIEQFSSIKGMNDNNIQIAGALDVIEFLRFMKELRPALVIVPLHDCEFNRAKSNIAWIEATMAGAVCLAPDWPEWKRPGVLNYKDQTDFARIMDQYLSGKIDGGMLWDDSARYIRDNLTIGKVNKARRDIIAAITLRRG